MKQTCAQQKAGLCRRQAKVGNGNLVAVVVLAEGLTERASIPKQTCVGTGGKSNLHGVRGGGQRPNSCWLAFTMVTDALSISRA